MKARTRFQYKVVAANERLLPITEAQQRWAFRNTMAHYAYRTPSDTTTCLDCGHQWKTESSQDACLCPHCNTRLKIKDTLQRTAQQRSTFSVLTTQDGLQVQRVFRMDATFSKGHRPTFSIMEVSRMWIDEQGKTAVTALKRCLGRYLDSFIYDNTLQLRKSSEVYDYIAANTFIYPRYRVLPIFRRNGLHGTFPDIAPIPLLTGILQDSRAETLLKAGRTAELAYFIDNPRAFDNCWQSLKIAMRHRYQIPDIQLWADYISLLKRQGKDAHSSHYVCPNDLRTAHDTALHQVKQADERKEREEKRIRALKDEKAFHDLKSKFFGLSFTDGLITVSVLDSVTAYLDEALAMHHCVYDLRYYLKPQSLCLSARINGKRIETVELSLTDYKVLQSRGVCNSNTEYHDRILQLVNDNAYLVRQRAAS